MRLLSRKAFSGCRLIETKPVPCVMSQGGSGQQVGSADFQNSYKKIGFSNMCLPKTFFKELSMCFGAEYCTPRVLLKPSPKLLLKSSAFQKISEYQLHTLKNLLKPALPDIKEINHLSCLLMKLVDRCRRRITENLSYLILFIIAKAALQPFC